MLIAILEWLAPAATIVAAIMTAANLGTRITGWGFVLFLIASVGWTALGISTGQNGLIYANAFLILVNAMGVWRWLGRQAAYEEGASAATDRSAREKVPSLFSFGELIGTDILDADGVRLGTIVDIMGVIDDHSIAYVVVSEGGIGGVGERLHALPASSLDLSGDLPSAQFNRHNLKALPILKAGSWPTKI